MSDLERKIIVCSGDIIVNISEGETVVDMKAHRSNKIALWRHI